MCGKRARLLRQVSGYNPNKNRLNRHYVAVVYKEKIVSSPIEDGIMPGIFQGNKVRIVKKTRGIINTAKEIYRGMKAIVNNKRKSYALS